MDVSSLRSLVTLVIQLHSVILFVQALSEERSQAMGDSVGDSKPKSCCYNGGLCVLGSFCHCPKNFYGRYCEREMKDRACGHIAHGSWVKAGCNLCRCFDGSMNCLPRAFDGCDDKPPSEVVNVWDYRDEMVVIASMETTTTKYDAQDADYYDYYDQGADHHSSGATLRLSAALTIMTFVLTLRTIVRTLWKLAS